MKPIQVGDTIPDFSLPDQDGNVFNISTVIGIKKIVLFFYPQDGSLNCTKEACYFRDLRDVFEEAGAVIIGISGQSVGSHKDFAEKNHLNYILLSDKQNDVRTLFGVPRHAFGMFPGRVTYVIDRSGRVVYIFNSHTDVMGHVDEALKICLLLKRSDATVS